MTRFGFSIGIVLFGALLVGCAPPGSPEPPAETPAGASEYVKEDAPAMTFTMGEGWRVHKDLPGELVLSDAGTDGWNEVIAWDAVHPVAFDGDPIGDPVADAAGFGSWLEENPDLVAAPVETFDIGGLPTLAFDIAVAPDARNGDAGCTDTTCVLMLDSPNFEIPWGISEGMGCRIWAIDRPDRQPLIVVAQTDTLEGLPAFLERLAPVLESIRFA